MSTSPSPERSRAQIAKRLQGSVGALTTATVNRMERDMPWFRDLSAEDRSWIGLIVQAGINSFVSWYRDPGTGSPVTSEVFGGAPRALTGVVSLHQTVEMVRLTIADGRLAVGNEENERQAPVGRRRTHRFA